MFKATLGIIQLACLTLAVFPGATRAAAPNSIQIEGDSAVFDQTSGNIIYSGSVIATQGDLMIAGDELTVALVDDDVDTIRTIGAPAKFSLRQAARDGEEQLADLRASASTIIFAPTANQLQLLGNATLQQSGNIIRSDAIIYDLNAQQIRADGDNERVRMEFEISDTTSLEASERQ